MTTSREVIAALYNHLTPKQGRRSWPGPPGGFCVEIQAPRTTIVGPRGGRRRSPISRADVVYAPKVGARGLTPTIKVYEVKVTRADLRNELANPAKCLPWKQYADYFTLVLGDAKIADGLDIPVGWGVMALESGRLKTIRRGAKLKPIDQGIAFNRIISYLAWRNYQLELSGATVLDQEEAA